MGRVNEPTDDHSRTQARTQALSHQKLKALQPELYSARSWRKFLRENGYRLSSPNEDADHWKEYVAENLSRGFCEAAVVTSSSPLMIAAYAGELDCVAMLRFPAQLAAKYDLKAGSRLLTINIYLEWNFFLPEDLNPGPRQTGKYRNFAPLIVEFLTDGEIIKEGKAAITEAQWRRAEALGKEYVMRNGEKARDGRPLLCHLPAKPPEKTRRR
jgi:hypothetical protein